MGTGLADVEPLGGVDLHEIELEKRVDRCRLDHATDFAEDHQLYHERSHAWVVADLCGAGADRQLVVIRAGKSVDGAARVSPQVPALWRRSRNGREEPSVP